MSVIVYIKNKQKKGNIFYHVYKRFFLFLG